MDHAALVRRGQPGAELPREIRGLVFGKTSNPPQRCREILAVDVLHREVQQPIGLTDVVHPADVWMGHLPRRSHFVVELCQTGRFVSQVVGQQLEGDRLTEPQIVRPIDLTHAAAAEQPDDPVTAVEHVARGEPAVTDRIRRAQPATGRRFRAWCRSPAGAGAPLGRRQLGELAVEGDRIGTDGVSARRAEFRRAGNVRAAIQTGDRSRHWKTGRPL